MKKSKLIVLSLLMLFALFNTSCKKDIEEINDISQTKESEVIRSVVSSFRNISSQSSQNGSSDINQAQSALNSYFCFDFVYPVSVIYNDGTTQSLANDNEFAQAIVDQTNTHYIINFVYPFEVIQNANTITINNDTDFENLINSCTTITPITPSQIFCFEFVYPVSVEMSDGSIVSVNNDTEFDDLFVNASNTFYPVDMVYPFDITQNGQSITIHNTVEFNALLDSCYGNGVVTSDLPPTMAFEQCFNLNYPLQILVDDGTSINYYPVTVNNDNEYNDVIFSTYPVAVDFVYPISVTDDNGNTQTFNDIYEFSYALYDCYSGGYNPVSYSQLPPSFIYDCVDLVYPVTIVMSDGTSQIANNVNEYDTIISNSNDVLFVIDFQYPVDIIFDGQTYSVNDYNELMDYVNQCGNIPGSYTASVCFTFNYPVTIFDANGTMNIAQNDQELDTIMNNLYPNGNQFPWLYQYISAFDFPITVTYNGSQITLNDWNDYYNLINNCNP